MSKEDGGGGDMPHFGLQDALVSMEDEKTELDKVLELLLDPRNIKHNTELSKNEITAFSVMTTINNRHHLPVLGEFLGENLVLRVSRNRGGRKEWVKIVARHMQQEEREDMPSGMRHLFRRRR